MIDLSVKWKIMMKNQDPHILIIAKFNRESANIDNANDVYVRKTFKSSTKHLSGLIMILLSNCTK